MGMLGQSYPSAVGVGPSVPPAPRQDVSDVVSAFILAVREGGDGGTFLAYPCRYSVGGYAETSAVLAPWLDAPGRARAALAFVEANPLKSIEGYGFWRDSNTGRIWLDKVMSHRTLDCALSEARVNGELAVWDCATNTEVRL